MADIGCARCCSCGAHHRETAGGVAAPDHRHRTLPSDAVEMAEISAVIALRPQRYWHPLQTVRVWTCVVRSGPNRDSADLTA